MNGPFPACVFPDIGRVLDHPDGGREVNFGRRASGRHSITAASQRPPVWLEKSGLAPPGLIKRKATRRSQGYLA
jgi:hypothetical protein